MTRRLVFALVAAIVVGPLVSAAPAAADDPVLTPDEMVALFDQADLAGTVPTTVPPAITGDPAADARISAIAQGRGYRLRPVATGPFDSANGVPLHPDASRALVALRQAAAADGVYIGLRYGFRSVELQRGFITSRLAGWSASAIAAGRADGTINAIFQGIAPPGYSKHHTGYVVDVTTSDGYRWLSVDNYANAKRFGWLPSYPPGASSFGPVPEPWEFVYVGTEAIRCAFDRCGYALAGDWDGDGVDTVSLRRQAQLLVNNLLATGPIAGVVAYGTPADRVVAGDWDGDGIDTMAVRRGRSVLVKSDLAGGAADFTVEYGRPDDPLLVGDWDGDGADSIAVRRGRDYHLKRTLSGGAADLVLSYGRPGDEAVVGDWDGDGVDSIGIRRGNVFYLRNSLTSGIADLVFSFGRPDDVVLVGDWNGDGIDTIGLQRGAEVFLRDDFVSGPAQRSYLLDLG